MPFELSRVKCEYRKAVSCACGLFVPLLRFVLCGLYAVSCQLFEVAFS